MDCSPEYIEMCIKAFGDIGILLMNGCPNQFIDRDYKEWASMLTLGGDEAGDFVIGQLYRQDQLQGMVFDESDNLRCQCGMIYDFVDSPLGTHYNTYGTLEQLWLAFVMWEKHQKKWDGTKWESK